MINTPVQRVSPERALQLATTIVNENISAWEQQFGTPVETQLVDSAKAIRLVKETADTITECSHSGSGSLHSQYFSFLQQLITSVLQSHHGSVLMSVALQVWSQKDLPPQHVQHVQHQRTSESETRLWLDRMCCSVFFARPSSPRSFIRSWILAGAWAPTTVQSEQDLRQHLIESGINTSHYGVGQAMTIAELFKWLTDGTRACLLVDTMSVVSTSSSSPRKEPRTRKLALVTSVVAVSVVRKDGRVLVESHQQLADG